MIDFTNCKIIPGRAYNGVNGQNRGHLCRPSEEACFSHPASYEEIAKLIA